MVVLGIESSGYCFILGGFLGGGASLIVVSCGGGGCWGEIVSSCLGGEFCCGGRGEGHRASADVYDRFCGGGPSSGWRSCCGCGMENCGLRCESWSCNILLLAIEGRGSSRCGSRYEVRVCRLELLLGRRHESLLLRLLYHDIAGSLWNVLKHSLSTK